MKSQEFYEKHWVKLKPGDAPVPGDAWFPGGFCGVLKPRILDKTDCLDPVGLQDYAVYRAPPNPLWGREVKSGAPLSPLTLLSRAYFNGTGLRLTARQVKDLVTADNALQSLIEDWNN